MIVRIQSIHFDASEQLQAFIQKKAANGEFYANKVCDTFEEAVDLCLEALGKQLVKYKEKQRSK